MPKKKKKKKKGNTEGAPVEGKMHEKAQELTFEMNRFCMKDRLQRLTKENRDLQVAYEDVKAQSEVAKRQQGDIQLFLNEKLDDQYDLIDELQNKLIQIKTNHEFEKKELIHEFLTEKAGLKNKITETQGTLELALEKLKSLELYKKERASFQARTNELESELNIVKNETTQQLIQLDRQRVKSKEKMAKNLREAIQKTRQATETEFASSYEANTMRAMEQNKRMFIELKYQEKEARKLMGENKQLLTKHNALATELKMYKAVQSEFATKSQVYQKVIRKLHERTQIKARDERGHGPSGPPVNTAAPERDTKSSRFSNQLDALQRKARRQQTVINRLRGELQKRDDRRADLLSFLLLSIDDVKKHPSITKLEANPRRFHISTLPKSYSSLLPPDREQLLDYFVACVHSKSLSIARSNFSVNLRSHPSLSLPPIGSESDDATPRVRSVGIQTEIEEDKHKKPRSSLFDSIVTHAPGETFVTEPAPSHSFEVRGFGKTITRVSASIMLKHRSMHAKTAPTRNFLL